MTKLFTILFFVAFYFSLNSSFTKMTTADCNAGIELACQQLNNEN